jgi:hypothetical protein
MVDAVNDTPLIAIVLRHSAEVIWSEELAVMAIRLARAKHLMTTVGALVRWCVGALVRWSDLYNQKK